jgi:hypothetical protein
MPHKHNDINHGVDPEQIRRYLAGELDDKAMHLLEKQALDDPFLAEALEGFAEYAPDQQLNLSDLDARLEQRVAGKKERKLPVYYRWAVAAAILLLAGIGVMKMWPLPETKEVANVVVKRDSIAPAAITDESGKAVDKTPALAAPDLAKSDIRKPLSEPVVTIPREERQVLKEEVARGSYSQGALSDKAPEIYKKESEMVSKDTVYEPAYAAASAPAPAASKARKIQSADLGSVAMSQPEPSRLRELKGKVIDKNNNPLQGASIRVANTNKGTVTDAEGNFALQVDKSANVKLNVDFVGYEHKNLDVANTENNLNITVPEINTSLDEVVVVAYGIQKKKSMRSYSTTTIKSEELKAAVRPPVPEQGIESYQKYLVQYIHYPSSAGNISGIVKVAFTVKANGKLRAFKVVGKLQPDCDKEAIRLIKDGPAWRPASNRKSARVEVEVEFNPEK